MQVNVGICTSIFSFLAVAAALAQVRQDLCQLVDDNVIICHSCCRLYQHNIKIQINKIN